MAIGVVCYPSLGGSGVVAADLATGLAGRGHRVHVIASAPPSRRLPECDRIRFHPVEATDYPLFDHPPYALAAASTIVEVARRHRLDLVHVHYAVPHAASAYLARQVLGAAAPRFVTTLHGTDVTGVGAQAAYKTITRFTVSASDALTVPSDYLRRAAYAALDLPAEPPIEVIPNFVDVEQFAPPARRDRSRFDKLFGAPRSGEERGPVLFHVSNFRAVKRVPDLFDVLARVRERIPARMVLVGDGPERAAAESSARAAGVASSVRFLGNSTDFAADLRHADAFVLPSETESFGVAALEALSSGVPVIAYRVGGLPEVVADGTGYLAEPFDTAALARAVLDAIGEAARREAMGRAARQHVLARFRAEPALGRYEACFRRTLGSSPRVPR
ncbi:MAG: N-acetyl-alpha-D-glucosaminyl L-malate synthase BshA [Candidatus Binatia bacterium]